MAHRFGVIFTAALLIAGATATAQAQRGFGFPGGGGFGGPYTATVTNTSLEKLTDGTTITHNSTIAEARDAEGRTYRSVTTPPTGSSSTGVTHTTVFDPVAHTITEWSSTSTTATLIQLPTNPPGNHGNWGGPGGPGGPGPRGNGKAQVTKTTLSPQSIAGVNATGVKTVVTIPTGAEGNSAPLVSTREVWTSPDLKILLLEKSDSPRDGSHKTEVTSLTPGAPDSALFQVPSNYTVKTETRHHGH